MITIFSNDLKVEIASLGAELQSLYHLQHQQEYMWNGDPAFWSKRSPILFPIVGQLKNNTYHYEGKEYQLPRHGFAREKNFILEHVCNDNATFLLVSDDSTKAVYPFDFELRVHYAVKDSSLTVTYDVHNVGAGTMNFSVGGHPAFKVPLAEGTTYDDYYIEFQHMETTYKMALENGLIGSPMPFLQYEKRIPLSHELFYKDAIVLKNLKSTRLFLKSDKTPRGLNFSFMGFPYFGIWAAKGADFVCLEPWHGIADSVNTDGELGEKEGIKLLEAGDRWQESWRVTCM